jgi:hypothetical protein
MKWMGHAEKILVVICEERELGGPRLGLQDNAELFLKKYGVRMWDWVHLT